MGKTALEDEGACGGVQRMRLRGNKYEDRAKRLEAIYTGIAHMYLTDWNIEYNTNIKLRGFDKPRENNSKTILNKYSIHEDGIQFTSPWIEDTLCSHKFLFKSALWNAYWETHSNSERGKNIRYSIGWWILKNIAWDA